MELGSDGRSLQALGPKDKSDRRPRCETEAGPNPFNTQPAKPRAAEPLGSARAAGNGGHLPTCPSAAAGSGWPPASHVDAPPEPHTGPTRAPPPPLPVRAPAAPTHWAGPRPPGPFKPGPYHRAGRGRPGTAGRPGARAGAAPAPGAAGSPARHPGPQEPPGSLHRERIPLRPAQWPRPRNTPLPLLPARRLRQPWDPCAPAPHPLGPRAPPKRTDPAPPGRPDARPGPPAAGARPPPCPPVRRAPAEDGAILARDTVAPEGHTPEGAANSRQVASVRTGGCQLFTPGASPS